MNEIALHNAVSACLGKSFQEIPCYRLLELLLPSWPPSQFVEVGVNWIQVGDMVAFDDTTPDHNTTVGIYLGNNKVVVSMSRHGVVLVPWSFVRKYFVWGGRCE